MTNQKYILEGTKIIPVDLLTWGRWLEEGRNGLWRDDIGDVLVSTIFLGLDHNFGMGGKPLLFETMIFGGAHDEYQKRYTAYKQAEAGHKKAVALVSQSQGGIK